MIDDLGDRADRLGTKVDRLADSVDDLADRQDVTERRGTRITAFVVLLTAMFLGLGLIAWQQYRTSASVDELKGSVCPVFGLVVGSSDPTSRPPGEARDRYESTIDAMRGAYVRLDCRSEFVPPRTGQ